jgi:hypothetical protein
MLSLFSVTSGHDCDLGTRYPRKTCAGMEYHHQDPRKFRFRLVSLDITTTMPATLLLANEQNDHASQSRRDSAVPEADPLAWNPRGTSPEPFVPFGSPKNIRPTSWDVPAPVAATGTDNGGIARATEERIAPRRTDDERHLEYR